MNKVHYDTDQEDLLRALDGRTTLVFEDGREMRNAMTKRAFSSIFTPEQITGFEPDDDHFLVHNVIVGAEETYGCFFAGTRVRTKRGWKAIEKIQAGEEILTHVGRYRKVTHTFQTPFKGVKTELKINGLPEPVGSTSNHPFFRIEARHLTPDKSRRRYMQRLGITREKWLQSRLDLGDHAAASSILPGDWVVVPVPRLQPNPALENLIDPYFAGFYVAEGCLVKEYREIASQGEWKNILITCGVQDAPCLNSIDQMLGRMGRHQPSRQKSLTSDKGLRVEYCWKEMADVFAQAFGCLAENKFLPCWIYQMPETWRLKFLAGYFDGDGCVAEPDKTKKKQTIGALRASTSSRDLALDLQLLCASLSISASVHHSPNKIANGCYGTRDVLLYEVSIGSTHSNRILSHTVRLKPHARNTRFPQSASVVRANGTHLFLRVSAVSHSEHAEQKFNLEVEEDNTYVVDIAGHNSNRNGDSWPKQACIDRCHTFVTKFAAGRENDYDGVTGGGMFYREHRNRDPREAIGFIKASAFHPQLMRIENVKWGHKKKAAEEYELAKQGKSLSFSMSARVPWDECSCCQQRAKKASLYCDHLKFHMNQYLPNFRKYAYARNLIPTFYDDSRVVAPADRIAHYLEYRFKDDEQQKAASANLIISGSDWAAYEGVKFPDDENTAYTLTKLAMLTKLAEEETWLRDLPRDAALTPKVAFVRSIADATRPRELDSASIEKFRTMQLGTLWREMAKRAAVMPFISFVAFYKGVSIEDAAKDETVKVAALRHLPGIYNKMLQNGDNPYMGELFEMSSDFVAACDTTRDHEGNQCLEKAAACCSLSPDQAKYRSMINAAQGQELPINDIDTNKSAASVDSDAAVLAEAYGHYQLRALCDIEQMRGENITDAQRVLNVATNRYVFR